MAVKPAAKTTAKRRKSKPASTHEARRPRIKKAGLGRTGLGFLVDNSPTPNIFEETPGRPPFDLQGK